MRDRTVQRTRVSIDGSSFILTPSQNVDELCEQFVDAVAGSGALVNFATTDGRRIRVLITPHSRVLITDETVSYESEESVLSLGSSGDWDLL